MMSEQFNVANGDRPDVQNIAIVITDGESTVDKYRTVTDAEAAHSAGIKVELINQIQLGCQGLLVILL